VAVSSIQHEYAPAVHNEAGTFTVGKFIAYGMAAVQRNIPLIITVWIAGLILFTARLLSGLAYTIRLTSSSLAVENEWSEYIHRTAAALGINRVIALAQSHAINSPMVIGYFKPVILIPLGMLSGLTTEQLETIFLHELAHIKRHDYLINLIQSVVETIFFFNPAIWVLS
jgi:beta-lactamase regulating signal transducer with metallopeptidase domain